MSNRIDFFQSPNEQLTLPAANALVLIDGQLCPWLEAAQIVRASWPEFGWARLVFNPALYPQDKQMLLEEIASKFDPGQQVSIVQNYNSSPPDAIVESLPIFAGQIDMVEMKIGPTGESIEIVARDLSAEFKHVTVYGRYIESADEPVFLPGLDSNFNEDGKPNAADEAINYQGKTYTLFSSSTIGAKFWTYAEAINYLLSTYASPGTLQMPALEQLKAITDEQTVRDLDVTGLNLLDALNRCCEEVGIKFKFVPRLAKTGPAQAINFYKNGFGRSIELNYQNPGEQINIHKTNLAVIDKQISRSVTHKYIGQGDFKNFEATFELVKAWDSSLETTDYEQFSPSTNPDFQKARDVYRKWALNEAGDYSEPPFNQGAAFDFSRIFGGSNFIYKNRRFWPALTTDKNGKSLGYFLQVSYDNGQNWWPYIHAFNNLLDQCGIWLGSDQLDVNTWIAALKGVLKFRITATVIADERLTCSVANGPVNSVIPVIEHIVTLPRRFKYQKVTPSSIFYNSSDESTGLPDEIDDGAVLFEFIRKKAQSAHELNGTIEVQTPYMCLHYQPGDKVTCSTQGRDLLDCRYNNRVINCVDRIQMDFEKQCTNLKILVQKELL